MSIKKCSTFKGTHQFLLQAWEAVYGQMFIAFKCGRHSDDEDSCILDILAAEKANMLTCSKKIGESESCNP